MVLALPEVAATIRVTSDTARTASTGLPGNGGAAATHTSAMTFLGGHLDHTRTVSECTSTGPRIFASTPIPPAPSGVPRPAA